MKYNMLELFKGTGSVGKVFKKEFNIISVDLDPIYNPTIQTDILNWDYKKINMIPDFIWASPPCNTFSPLAYPLKERDTQTAEPRSERAKTGTKILYKTLEIIHYFKKLNPNLLFVIENPEGMMRKDKKIKQLLLNNTLYCLYGDERRKSTDFFSNFPLNLKEGTKCPNQTKSVEYLPLKERYKIPSKLIKHIKDEFFKNYNKIKGGSINKNVEEVEEVIEEPMGDDDIRQYLPTAKIITYDELNKYRNIEQILNNPTDYLIILYRNSPSRGHWVCLLKYNDTIEFFDPYGLEPDKELKWESCSTNQKLGQGYEKLTELLNNTDRNVIYNPIKYQKVDGDINTCGRHCVFRILHLLKYNYSLPQYYFKMKELKDKYSVDYDYIVASYIDKI